MSEWAVGQIIGDKYRLEAFLGEGGMGTVWRAEHMVLGSPIAIKLVHPENADDPQTRARFLREARAAAVLRSPHVVQILDHGLHEERVPYIAMELLEGETLANRLEKTGGKLASSEVTKIMNQVARAITKAHEIGIIHRDLKPENIFLAKNDDEEVAKVLDFGIAKVTGGVKSVDQPAQSTRAGSMVGTPFYMSPEQVYGKPVDWRTDLWSMAVITFQCICGRLPFTSKAVGALIVEICSAPIPVPSKVAMDASKDFDAWFAKALSRDLAQRFQSAKEQAKALQAALTGFPNAESTGKVRAVAVRIHDLGDVGDSGVHDKTLAAPPLSPAKDRPPPSSKLTPGPQSPRVQAPQQPVAIRVELPGLFDPSPESAPRPAAGTPLPRKAPALAELPTATPKKSQLPLLLVLGTLGVAVAGAVVWFALHAR